MQPFQPDSHSAPVSASTAFTNSYEKPQLTSSLPTVRQSRYDRILCKVKRSARSEISLQQWASRGLSSVNFWIDPKLDQVKRIHYDQVSTQEFIKKWEAPGLPVVIVGATDQWSANTAWNVETLARRYRNEKVKIGQDDDGKAVYIGVKYFFHYALTDPNGAAVDDSPLYIFDGSFGSRTQNNTARRPQSKTVADESKFKPADGDSMPLCHLIDDFELPKYFTDDLFRLVGKRRRPPYRWIVIGPARSGTGIHIDPLGTSAWNALLQGHKRWVLFPPGAPKDIIEPKSLQDHEAVTWFTHVYPKLSDQHPNSPTGKTYAQVFGMIDILQGPGETVFVPGGWSHVVMNIDFTVAITQNFCSRTNIEYVWLHTRYSRPKMAEKLLRVLSYSSKLLAQSSQLESSSQSTTCLGKRKDRKRRQQRQKREDRRMRQLLHGTSEADLKVYIKLVGKLQTLNTIPRVYQSSSSSSSSSSSTTTSSESESESGSEPDAPIAKCICSKCIARRSRHKSKRARLQVSGH
ncbi:hypothetical protein QVD99_007321 [Batrachochytrium dendrobatidis]|nr:hypothetical protein O5D80_008519 [Batrachochytrium dendrobatidis]KAK5665671.1 hypothetical protein QVD99_007321 [Batrachochytrium dendrobatidis]